MNEDLLISFERALTKDRKKVLVPIQTLYVKNIESCSNQELHDMSFLLKDLSLYFQSLYDARKK